MEHMGAECSESHGPCQHAELITREIEEGVFDYLRWFPDGNLVPRFGAASTTEPSRLITVRGFFNRWDLAGGNRELNA